METNEKVNPIIIHDKRNGRDYTLEFNRETIKFAENRGFKMEDLADFPMSKTPEFFWYAFRMHHPSVSLQQAERLLDDLGGVGGLDEAVGIRLGELWAAPFKSLKDDGGEEKNGEVTVEL